MRTYMKCLALLTALGLMQGCGGGDHPESESPATVQNAVEETELASITLSAQAEARLGVETAAVEYRGVRRTRTLGGDVMVVPGRSVSVTAPVPSMVLSPEGASIPPAGRTVGRGRELCRLLPTLPDMDLLSTRDNVELKQVQYELAQARAERAERMLNDRAGSVREHEEAQAELVRAEMALKAAQVQLELLEGGSPDPESGVLSSLVVASPLGGVIQNVYVAAGQAVYAGAPLFDITDMDPVWVKVPVYSGDLARIDTGETVQVHTLADVAGTDPHPARPVTAPLTADPRSVTADIFFELRNREGDFRPGQRVSVVLFTKESAQRPVIPYSAVLYDMYGGAWVYANTASHVYVRTRVELDYVMEGMAVLTKGPPEGTMVVSVGAAELFGTEFGVGK